MAQEMDIISHTLWAVTVYATMIVIAQKLGDNTTHQQAGMTSVSHAYRLGPMFSPCLTFIFTHERDRPREPCQRDGVHFRLNQRRQTALHTYTRYFVGVMKP